MVKKKHENVFKNWLRPNFLLLPPKTGGLENLGQPPFAPLARTPPLTKLKRISSSSNNYLVLTF